MVSGWDTNSRSDNGYSLLLSCHHLWCWKLHLPSHCRLHATQWPHYHCPIQLYGCSTDL
jgi:hypothetical protein